MMGVCGNAIAACTGLAGCGGRLCRNMRNALSRMEYLRYELNELGERSGDEPVKGMLCGFVTKLHAPSDPSCAVPGILGTASNVRLTVVASADALMVGDIVLTNGKSYRVQSQLSDLPVRFSLVETEESYEVEYH